MFLPKQEIPSEQEQYEIYRKLIEGMKGLPVTIRTFDIGGDKLLLNEQATWFGGRATRFLLKEKTILKTQPYSR